MSVPFSCLISYIFLLSLTGISQAVLAPAPAPARARAPAPAPGPSKTCPTVLSIIASEPTLSISYHDTKLIGYATKEGKWGNPGFKGTVFAPTNKAHDRFYAKYSVGPIPDDATADILAIDKTITDYHLLTGVYKTAASLTNGSTLTTDYKAAPPIDVRVAENGTISLLAIGGPANIINSILACEAIVHIIDDLLVYIPADFV